MLFCPTCANLLVVSSETGYNKWACNTCAYEFPITKQVGGIVAQKPAFALKAQHKNFQMTSRTKLKRKQIDDVLGGDEMWAHADKTMGEPPNSGPSDFLSHTSLDRIYLELIVLSDLQTHLDIGVNVALALSTYLSNISPVLCPVRARRSRSHYPASYNRLAVLRVLILFCAQLRQPYLFIGTFRSLPAPSLIIYTHNPQYLPTLATSIISQISHQPDEDFINKSLLDSLNAQADAEPIFSSDSEQASHSYGSASNNSSSSGGSPSVPYHIAMQGHHQSLTHPDSPEAIKPQHIPSHDPMYPHQNLLFPSDNLHNIQPDYVAEHESRKIQQSHKLDNLNNFRTNSFNQFGPIRTRQQAARPGLPSTNSFRETPQSYPPGVEVFSPNMTSPIQQHLPTFDSRASFNGQIGLNNIVPKPFIEVFPSQNIHPSLVNGHKSHQPQLPQRTAYPAYTTHLSSQTPYGPHVPTAPAVPSALNGSNASGSLNSAQGLPSTQNVSSTSASNSSGNNEEISTIFVVGFPEDMQEREFQNMFTFSTDFEAATLKIPNKEYTAYGSIAGGGPGNTGSLRGTYPGYSGANDPYNIVTLNQGGVVVDGGRDGTMVSWPSTAPGDESNGPFGTAGNPQGINVPPRKQIIGFAKFKTRQAALAARDSLQGRRVDIDKGAVLKAEMAKKNLHTKRGVGPVPGGTVSNSTTTGGAPTASGFQQNLNNGAAEGAESVTLGQNEVLSSGNGLPQGSGRLNNWREQAQHPEHHLSNIPNGGAVPDRDDEDRRVILNGLAGFGTFGGATRGPRERAEDDERERRRKDKEMMRLRGNLSAYEAFYSVPPGNAPLTNSSRQLSIQSGPGLSDHELATGTSPLSNGFATSRPIPQAQEEFAGPWDNVKNRAVPIPRSTTSQRSNSPPSNGSVFDAPPRSFSPVESHQFLEQARHDPQYVSLRNHTSSESSASSVVGGPQSIGHSSGSGSDGHVGDIELSRALGGLDLNLSDGGKISPQLPSPASGASSRNGVDQNPPINTLYVGNLPTSSPPNGFPQDYLEESLRELFSARLGYRRLCFRQKSNGPMCFVEFEDVAHATRALNELYGDTLKGLVKGGIRLSYSKNPLGVRTPPSTTSIGSSLQQQQIQSNNGPAPILSSTVSGQDFQPRKDEQQSRVPPAILRRDVSLVTSQSPPVQSPFVPELLGTSPPPPRFVSSSPNGLSASSNTTLTHASKSSVPRYAFGLPTNASHAQVSTFSPFGLSSTPPPQSIIPDLPSEGYLSSHSPHFHNNSAPASK
ncbi:hypothetical protein C0993_011030 [Termitomyces sp. T159_Od127]|nr:hypothetical protein C0993_011030 [Termitomyces sp. T159_Od127]